MGLPFKKELLRILLLWRNFPVQKIYPFSTTCIKILYVVVHINDGFVTPLHSPSDSALLVPSVQCIEENLGEDECRVHTLSIMCQPVMCYPLMPKVQLITTVRNLLRIGIVLRNWCHS